MPLGEGKYIFMPMDLGAGVGEEVDLHYIEAGIDGFLGAEEAEPVEEADAQEAAFGGVYHAHGGAAAVVGGAFYFYGDEGVAVAADEVELAAFAPAPVAAQDFNPVCAQVRGGNELAVFTHAGGGGWGCIRAPRAAPFVQQAQMSGDGES